MKLLKPILLAIIVGTVVSSNCAWADRGRGGGGGGHFVGHDRGHFHRHFGSVFLAAPLFYPWPYWSDTYPYYIYSSPPVYVEQGTSSSGYWYYCADPPGFYPSVTECPERWVRVAPAPPQ